MRPFFLPDAIKRNNACASEGSHTRQPPNRRRPYRAPLVHDDSHDRLTRSVLYVASLTRRPVPPDLRLSKAVFFLKKRECGSDLFHVLASHVAHLMGPTTKAPRPQLWIGNPQGILQGQGSHDPRVSELRSRS